MLLKILNELEMLANHIDKHQLERASELIQSSQHIYLAGAGRSGLMIKAFANRLLHLGLAVYLVGEVTSPHTNVGDLLIIGSGSGETESLLQIATKAKKNGMSILLITANAKSQIGQLADEVIVIPANTKFATKESLQPMGSAFEQMSLLVYDVLILKLMDSLQETSDSMFQRHANLE